MVEQVYQPIAELLQRVRTRWRRLVMARAVARGSLIAAVVLGVTLLITRWLPASALAVALVGGGGLLFAAAALVLSLRSLRDSPSDRTLARFVEEKTGTLEQRVISAVDLATGAEARRPVFAAAMIGDAARAITNIDASSVVPAELLRRAGFQAAAALLALLVVVGVGRQSMRRVYDAAALTMFPAHVTLAVSPGHARVEAGKGIRINAELVGSAAPVVPQLLRALPGQDEWQRIDMVPSNDGRYTAALDGLTSSFQYRVLAGAVASETFNVSVVRAPRVSSIDVEYSYPKAFGLPPRTEENGGDIYAPPGTEVRLRVHTDTVAASGQVVLAEQPAIALTADGDGRTLTGALTVRADGSYRVALADGQGLGSNGDTEYFIRTMDDRPPDVHVVRPASDRRVTALEEVEIAAEAADDFGVASLELVYAVRGGAEQVVPLRIPARETSVTGSYLLYLEDLDVRPGDFVSYYVRATDVPRGRRAAEARSDIFFLEIKNFEEEFTLAQSQAAQGGGASNPQLDELVAAQKEVIVATWKLDRRAKASRAQSAQDVRAVAEAESELKTRVERVATSLRTSTMRDPRARTPAGRGGARGGLPGSGAAARVQKLSEEEAMTAAGVAMGRAVTALSALKTPDAIAPEMEALNRLLEAQSDIRKREVQRQQAGGGSGSNRNVQDLSSLFDKELARTQQTNYENQSSASTRDEQQASAADKIKDLAKRQDELLMREQDLANRRAQLSAEEMTRELEKLTREQNDLQQRAEEVAQELARRRQESGSQSGQSPSQPQAGSRGQNQPGQNQQGQQSAANSSNPGSQQGQSGQAGSQGSPRPQPGAQQGQSGQSGQSGSQPSPSGQGSENERRLRAASEEMRAAAGELRRQDPEEARARAQRALDGLRELERQIDAGSSEGRRRALGDVQLEARQLADAERQIAADARQASAQGGGNADAMRRLAGEQERLAERLADVQQRLQQQARQSGPGAPGGDTQALQQTATDAARDIERQRLAERMRQSAEAMRAQAAQSSSAQSATSGRGGQQGQSQSDARNSAGPQTGSTGGTQGSAQAQEEIARALDRVADRLANSDRGRDAEAERLAEQRARAQELRDRLDETTERLAELDRQATQSGQQSGRSGNSASAGNRGDPSPAARAGQGSSSASSAEVARLREEMAQQVEALQALLGEARRDGQQPGGLGKTFEGQGMVLSAPGTEGFKQDFARWQELKRQATVALESIEASASQRLQAKESKDRLTTGIDERPPTGYQSQVDSYFKALAAKKAP